MNSNTELVWLVPEAEHDRLVAAVFAGRGYVADEIEGMTRVCREAAAHGIRTHNAIKAFHLDETLGSGVGGCRPGAVVEDISGPFPGLRNWHAHGKPGPGVAYAAMETCLELAGRFGIGAVSVQDAWHYLWGGAYALQAARRGFVGYTQCTGLLAEVVPFGGRRPALGTNPHTWAFPTQASVGFPVLVDFATSAVARGRVQQWAREGKPLPPGVAVDAAGSETRDPQAVAALLPFGGHKGYGLGLVNEMMSALAGAGPPSLRGRFDAPAGAPRRTATFFFLALHPDAMAGGAAGGGQSWEANLGVVLADILGQGNESARLPGAPEAAATALSARSGGLLFTGPELEALDAEADRCGLARVGRQHLMVRQ